MGYHKKHDREIVQFVIGKYQNVGPPYRLIIEKRYKNVNNRTENGCFVENNADNRLQSALNRSKYDFPLFYEVNSKNYKDGLSF